MAKVAEVFLHHHHHHHHRLLHIPHGSSFSEEEVEAQIIRDPVDDDDDDDSEYWSSSLEIQDHGSGLLEPPHPSGLLENAGSVGARVLDRVQEIGSDFLGIGFGYDRGEEIDLEEEEEAGEDDGEDVCVGGGDEGLRIVGFELESEEGEDAGGQLQWDCLRIEDARREVGEEFEWEEVDDRGVVGGAEEDIGGAEEDREVVDRAGELVDPREGMEEEEGEVEVARNIEWEVLLTMNNIERNSSFSVEHADFESIVGEEQDQDDYVYPSEYDVLFGQFVEHDDSLVKGSLPAASSVVEGLPSVILSHEDVDKSNALCAVCKDDIAAGESVKQLPCLHHYHEGCILPWLRMRNTCPVCRHELPSDDPDYENTRATRADVAGRPDESRPRYMFEMLPVE